MVRHIVVWHFADGFSFHQNQLNAVRVKNELEYLPNVINGIAAYEVIIDPLSTCDGDIILNSLFVDEAALKKYQAHHEHKKASEFVKKVTKDKICIDYIE
ncbi:MAG: Dabb family protein [Clostridiales bacterium]|jgi:hypothetical protein|nr:Dabb family protein [Clostridiales bacterium]